MGFWQSDVLSIAPKAVWLLMRLGIALAAEIAAALSCFYIDRLSCVLQRTWKRAPCARCDLLSRRRALSGSAGGVTHLVAVCCKAQTVHAMAWNIFGDIRWHRCSSSCVDMLLACVICCGCDQSDASSHVEFLIESPCDTPC